MLQLSERARMGRFLRLWDASWRSFREWLESQGVWWAVSVTAHAVVLSAALLVLGSFTLPQTASKQTIFTVDTTIAPPVESKLEMLPPEEMTPPIMADLTAIEPTTNPAVDADLTNSVTATIDGTSENLAASAGAGLELGGAAGFHFDGSSGAGPNRNFGIGSGGERGPGEKPGFGGRDRRHNLPGTGRTKPTDAAVGRALAWIARHQDASGRWSLQQFTRQCTDASCACKAGDSDTAATALALLPYLAAGQTHTKGSYRKHVERGLAWLASQQKSNGDLRSGNGSMYAHGLATITLCEAYGLSKDPRVGAPAQQAINFIVSAQDSVGGGWRYEPGQPGDTSAAAWQIMALKSGMMAGLNVPSQTMERAAKFLKSVGTGEGGFGYQEPGSDLATSAAGVLCMQYFGANREDANVRGGARLFMANLPAPAAAHPYYWYYATQVMHNMYDSDWDIWNRRMRKVLVESQDLEGCAAGSWDPAGQVWGDNGGRLMVTALSTLTLEVYYRNLPLYRTAKHVGPRPKK